MGKKPAARMEPPLLKLLGLRLVRLLSCVAVWTYALRNLSLELVKGEGPDDEIVASSFEATPS